MTVISTTARLTDASIEVIRAGQHSSGAYVACPDYPTYNYAWLRDGAFTAHAMDLVGQSDSAAAFHDWAATTMLAHRHRIRQATQTANELGHQGRMMPTRFTLDGHEEASQTGEEEWPNFQLDGYGTWLWALVDHHARTNAPVDPDCRDAVELVADYLIAAAHLPCYDCWEEHPTNRHTSTLAAVLAGLRAAASLVDVPRIDAAADELADQLVARHINNGTYVKHDGDPGVDASLLWLALPFGVVDVHDPVIGATARRIKRDLLVEDGGMRRYRGDTFYGGGEWILLTAWLGWYQAARGDHKTARRHLAWIEDQATADGHLPEQITDHPQDPGMVAPWVNRWGPVATPLLWSHAMYLTLVDALNS